MILNLVVQFFIVTAVLKIKKLLSKNVTEH